MKINEYALHTLPADNDALLIWDSTALSTKQIKLSALKGYFGVPVVDNTILLLHLNGANNSTTFTDVKGKIVTPSGNVIISTAQAKFGVSSAYFDGTGDFLTVPVSSDFQFAGNSFTWECWARPATVTPSSPMALLSNAQGATAGNAGLFLAVSSSKFVFRHWINGSSPANSSQNIAINTWYHVAVTKVGTELNIFVDGVKGTTGSTNATNTDNQFTIGRVQNNSGFASDFSGYLDEICITKTVAKYTANFTPPTTEFT